MSNIKISLVASAIRTQLWQRFYDSCKGNTIEWEVIFVGNRKPDFPLPNNFKYIYATVKPAQCYEIGFRASQGELISWTADDAYYNGNGTNNLDKIYNFWKGFNDYKTVVAMRPIEDGRDIWYRHHFFGDWKNTPIMAPFGFIHRKWFIEELGGYDKRFIAGQSENDVVMRVYEAGGKVEQSMDAYAHVDHRTSHETHSPSGMRKYYVADRQFLENCWVEGGWGAYGQGGACLRPNVKISKVRLIVFEKFSEDKITEISQEPKGEANPPWS